MNWAHKEVELGWIGLVRNVLRKWISTIIELGESSSDEFHKLIAPLLEGEIFILFKTIESGGKGTEGKDLVSSAWLIWKKGKNQKSKGSFLPRLIVYDSSNFGKNKEKS